MKNIVTLFIIILNCFSALSQSEGKVIDSVKPTQANKSNPFVPGDKINKQEGCCGKGLGPGMDSTRIRLNDPNLSEINSKTDETIHLILTIDANGSIISVRNSLKTTTNDQDLINQVMTATKKQVKYIEKPNAGLEQAYLTVRIKAK